MGYAYSFAINYIYVYREQHAKMRAKIVPARCLHVHVLSYCHLSHVTLSLVTVTVTVAVAVTVTVTVTVTGHSLVCFTFLTYILHHWIIARAKQ